VVNFKNKHAPATLKKCISSVLAISSPPQSRETVPLSWNLWQNFKDFLNRAKECKRSFHYRIEQLKIGLN